MRFLLIIVSLAALASAGSNPARAAEYSEEWDYPWLAALVFTADHVGMVLEPITPYRDSDSEHAEHFVAPRDAREFQPVSPEAFGQHRNSEHVEVRPYPSRRAPQNFTVVYPDDCKTVGNIAARRTKGLVEIEFEAQTFEVALQCNSSVADALMHNDLAWIATYEHSDHGSYGAEGVVIASKADAEPIHVDIRLFAADRLIVDPYASDVWVIARSQLVRIAKDGDVISRYWTFVDFERDGVRPRTFVAESDNELINNPLAVMASWLGESSYESLAAASRAGVELREREPLYNLAMFGNYFNWNPYFPLELEPTLDHAQPTLIWRRFACLNRSERAKALCALELEDWPVARSASPAQ